jgi:hypothetical protein
MAKELKMNTRYRATFVAKIYSNSMYGMNMNGLKIMFNGSAITGKP